MAKKKKNKLSIAYEYKKLTLKEIEEEVKKGYVVFYNIKWDTDGEKVKLPLAIRVPRTEFDADFDFSLEGANYISDNLFDWCIESFQFKN
jgi:hypothetical protein